jgi:2-phosphoglycerate kinase
MMADPRVIVIGGPPFSGKTTLAKRLVAQRGYALVAIDDLATAARAVTTAQSHPALHPMVGWDYRAYYLAHTPAVLIDHSTQEHQALWPAVVAVIEAHLQWAEPVILEGWQLDPARVASIAHPQLRAYWLLVDDTVLEARLRADTTFYQGCADAERLIRHYLARSHWVNNRVRQAAVQGPGVVLEVKPGETVDAIAARCVSHLWPGDAAG